MAADTSSAATPGALHRLGLRWSVGAGKWAMGSSVALLFPVIYLVGVWQQPDVGVGRAVLATVLLAVAAAGYVVLPGVALDAPPSTRWWVVGVLLVLWGSQLPVVGAGGVVALIFPGVSAGFLLRAREAVGVAAVLAGVIAGVSAAAGETQWELALTEFAVTLWMVGFAGNVRLTRELSAAREELAFAAVARERERIGRDLHDILGHSLTAVTVKTALARQLLASRPEAAAQQLDEIEQLARSALRDVRATASGIRETTLAGELAVARSVLRAAGITADVPSAVDDVAPGGRELFGFVLREAVTNVVRHSGASTCSVQLGPRSIEVRDDGTGAGTARDGGTEGGGTGLDGLAQRVAAAGGVLVAGPLQPRGFRVRAELPSGTAA